MRKKTALMITALAATAALSPATVQAAGIDGMNRGGVVIGSGAAEDIRERLEANGWNEESFKWGTVIWSSNCPTIPDFGGNGDNGENDGNNGGAGGENGDTENPDGNNGGVENPGGGDEGTENPDGNPGGDSDNGGGNEDRPGQEEDQNSNQTFAQQVVSLVNAERAKEGLGALTVDAGIEKAALVRAKEIQSSFSHTRPNGAGFSTALQEAGVNYRASGENIAWGQRSPEEVVTGWMNSPSHRANIMNGNYSRIGVGHLQNADGVSYWVQLFAN